MSEDIRMPELRINFDGKDVILRCNFNVIADVQEMNGGTLPEVLNAGKSLNNFLCFLTAMINEYADEVGWPERYTPKQVGRIVDITDGSLLTEVMTLVVKALYKKTDKTEPTDSKNSEATQI